MLTVARLRKKPRHFKSFTGLTPEQFDALLAALTPVYLELERARKSRPSRQRAVGGGHPFELALAERLLMVLMYLRLYTTESLLGYLFHLHESNVNRERNQRMLPALEQVLPMPMREELGLLGEAAAKRARESASAAGAEGGTGGGSTGAPRTKKIGTLEELLRAYPEIQEVLIDATEQPVQRPREKQAQKHYYSGKKKRHTCKTQVLTDKKRVLHASRCVPGSLNDLVLLRFSGVLHQVPPGCRARVDKGYEGVEEEYPQVAIEKPIKAQRNHPLTAFGKAYNRMQSRLRIVVEHVLAHLEKFQILAGLYRGQRSGYDTCFGVVCGLHNFRTMGQLSW
jgi:hypothetical protein